MPATGHAFKTIERATTSTYDQIYGPGGTIHVRVSLCLRCERPINGWGFYTHYGPLLRPDGTRVQSCGEFVHHRCPAPGVGRREIFHDAPYLGPSIHPKHKKVAPGIFEIMGTGRYAAQDDKKRLGTFDTFELAKQARDEYLAQLNSKERHGRTHRKTKHPA